MPIDSAFVPKGPTYFVGTTATLCQGNIGTLLAAFRVRNLSAAQQYFAWGGSKVSAPVAPASATPLQPNTLGVAPNATEVFVLPATSWFIASAAAGFEITPGEGV